MSELHYDGPVVLVVMDGVGLSPKTEGNALKAAHLETLRKLIKHYPTAKLGAHGDYVGIPSQDMGNSEVGHNAIGAGEIVAQSTKAVDDAIIGEKAFHEPVWQNAIANAGNPPSNNAMTIQGSWNVTDIVGKNKSHNNLQPYISVYFWKRTA